MSKGSLTTISTLSVIIVGVVGVLVWAQSSPQLGDVDTRIAGIYADGQVPVGTVISFWGTMDEVRRLKSFELCDGKPVTAEGSPILGRPKPDMRDRFIMGVGDDSPDIVGSPIKGGENTTPEIKLGTTLPHILTIDEIPAHDHGGKTGEVGAVTISSPGKLVHQTDQWGAQEHGDTTGDRYSILTKDTIDPVVPAHSHTIASQGGGKPHTHDLPPIPPQENRPLYQGMYFLIRVK